MNPVAVTGLALFLPGYWDPIRLFTDLSCDVSLLKMHYLDEYQAVPVVCSAMESSDLEQLAHSYPYLKPDNISVTAKIGTYAAMQAIASSNIEPRVLSNRCGLFVGCNKNLPNFHDFYQPSHVPQDRLKQLHQHQVTEIIADKAAVKGPAMTFGDACVSGVSAIISGQRRIQSGELDYAICGATEQATHPIMQHSFAKLGALATKNLENPTSVCRPFDKNRSGCLLADGAAFLVLEDLEHAVQRKANIHSLLVSSSRQSEAYKLTTTQPDGSDYVRCMQAALRNAGLSACDIQHISAHGTSTPNNDVSEGKAIERIFYDPIKQAYPDGFSVTSTKSALGHALGASGAIEAVLSILSLQKQKVLPTLNYQKPGEGEACLPIVRKSRAQKINHLLSNSFGFGGENACLIFSNYGQN